MPIFIDGVPVTADAKQITYDAANVAKQVTEQNPEGTQYVNESVNILTDVPNGTPDETTIITMNGYRGCAIHIEKTGGADTFAAIVFASVEGTGAAVDWIDVTQYGFTCATAADAASYTADCILFSNPGFVPQAFKVRITTAGAAHDADFQIFTRKWV